MALAAVPETAWQWGATASQDDPGGLVE